MFCLGNPSAQIDFYFFYLRGKNKNEKVAQIAYREGGGAIWVMRRPLGQAEEIECRSALFLAIP